jgi:hypothetical protein
VFYSDGRCEDSVGGEEATGGEVVVHIDAVSCGCNEEAPNKQEYKGCLALVKNAHIQVFGRALQFRDL